MISIKKILLASLLLLPLKLMADTGDIPVSGNFQENTGRPLDSKLVTASAATRVAMGSTLVYAGMVVYQKDTEHTWQLQGSTYNWVDLGILSLGGGGGGNSIYPATGTPSFPLGMSASTDRK